MEMTADQKRKLRDLWQRVYLIHEEIVAMLAEVRGEEMQGPTPVNGGTPNKWSVNALRNAADTLEALGKEFGDGS